VVPASRTSGQLRAETRPGTVRRLTSDTPMSESCEPPANSTTPESPRVHGSHLVCAIRSDPDGTRFSTCPVCVAHSTLPSADGWLSVKCDSCGSEFIASDGSPPPAPPEPLPAPPPPPVPTTPAKPPRGVGVDAAGRWFVLCPHCFLVDVAIPKRFSHELELSCPECRGTFVVSEDHLPVKRSPAIPTAAHDSASRPTPSGYPSYPLPSTPEAELLDDDPGSFVMVTLKICFWSVIFLAACCSGCMAIGSLFRFITRLLSGG
jgi:hypothetical protein